MTKSIEIAYHYVTPSGDSFKFVDDGFPSSVHVQHMRKGEPDSPSYSPISNTSVSFGANSSTSASLQSNNEVIQESTNVTEPKESTNVTEPEESTNVTAPVFLGSIVDFTLSFPKRPPAIVALRRFRRSVQDLVKLDNGVETPFARFDRLFLRAVGAFPLLSTFLGDDLFQPLASRLR